MLYYTLRKEQVFLSNTSLTIKRCKCIPLCIIILTAIGTTAFLLTTMFQSSDIKSVWTCIAAITMLIFIFSNHRIDLPADKTQIPYSSIKKVTFKSYKSTKWVSRLINLYAIQMDFIDTTDKCWTVHTILGRNQLLKVMLILVKKDVRVEKAAMLNNSYRINFINALALLTNYSILNALN